MRTSALAVVLAAASCTASVAEFDECASNADCRAAFGSGYVCGENGFCSTAPFPLRCDRSEPPGVIAQPDQFRQAFWVASMVDRRLETHRARERSIALATRQANEQGGLDGRNVAVLMCNIESGVGGDVLPRTEAAVAVAQAVSKDLGVTAVIGPPSSGDTREVFINTRPQGLLLITPSGTSVELTDIDNTSPTDEAPGLLWRTAPSDRLQGEMIAADLDSRGVNQLLVIQEAGTYGDALATIVASNFSGSSTVLSFDSPSIRDERIVSGGTMTFDEVLFISSQTADAVAFLIAAVQIAGYQGKGLYFTDAAANLDFLDGARASASALFPQVRGTRPQPLEQSDPTFANFVVGYSTAHSGEDVTQFSFTAQSYDAAWMVFAGLAWAHFQEGAIEGINLARGMRRVSDSTAQTVTLTPSGWPTLREAFAAGQSVDLRGASGDLDFDSSTEEVSGGFQLWKISADGLALEAVTTP